MSEQRTRQKRDVHAANTTPERESERDGRGAPRGTVMTKTIAGGRNGEESTEAATTRSATSSSVSGVTATTRRGSGRERTSVEDEGRERLGPDVHLARFEPRFIPSRRRLTGLAPGHADRMTKMTGTSSGEPVMPRDRAKREDRKVTRGPPNSARPRVPRRFLPSLHLPPSRHAGARLRTQLLPCARCGGGLRCGGRGCRHLGAKCAQPLQPRAGARGVIRHHRSADPRLPA